MNIPKWLLPIVAVVAAVAVGVAAVLVGMRFAPSTPASAFVPPSTEIATVLAPVADEDGDDGEADDDGSSDPDDGDSGSTSEPPLSDEIGEREVAVAEEDAATTDSELLRLIDLLALSPDLLLGLMHLGLGERDDDPCAPRDGTPPADGCPPGAPGTVLFTDPLPPLWMNAAVWARPHAELGDLPDRDLGDLMCDPAPALEGDAGMRIRATAPGTWTVRYWPTEHPERVATTEPLVSSDQQADDWSVEAHRETDGFYIAEHCLLLSDLEPATAYTAVVSGEDFFGRSPADHTVLFNSDGLPQHPALSIQTVGQNLLLASAPHAADEVVDVKSVLVDPGTPVSCTQPDDARYFGALSSVDHVAVGEPERQGLNITSDNTEKIVVSYRVPEGATVLLCARWFPAGDVPVWESAQATYESSLIIQSADRMLPQVELTGFTPRDDRSVDLDVRVDTAEGLLCGAADWSTGAALPSVLCDAAAVSTGGAGRDGGRLFDRGFSGDLVLRMDGVLSSGETSETTYLLPMLEPPCAGVCVAPPTRTYSVATIGGTAQVRVSWVTGLQNGRSEWTVTSTVSRPLDYVMPDRPQIDTTAGWEFGPLGFVPVVTAQLRLPVDRQVDWTLTSTAAYTGEPGMTCHDTPRPVAASGTSVDDVVRIRLEGLCLGSNHSLTLRLVDAAGNVAIWDAGTRDTWWGPAALLQVPSLDVTVRYRVDVYEAGYLYLQRFALNINAYDYPLRNDYADSSGARCTRPDGRVKSEGEFSWTITAETSIGMNIRLVDREGSGCAGRIDDSPFVPAITTATVQQLGSIDGVTFSTSDPSATLHVWMERR